MSKGFNKVKKNIVKQSIMEGKTYKQALLDAGYTPATAYQSSSNGIVKYCLEEIARDFDKAKITPEYVLAGLNKEAQEAQTASDRIKALELLGKYLAMFTEKQIIDAKVLSQEEQTRLNQYLTVTGN